MMRSASALPGSGTGRTASGTATAWVAEVRPADEHAVVVQDPVQEYGSAVRDPVAPPVQEYG